MDNFFKIKFGTCVKIGAGVYVGFTVAKHLDRRLGEAIYRSVNENTQQQNGNENDINVE